MLTLNFIPPNLADLGVARAVPDKADLLTIWKTPYPVLSRYKLLCQDLRVQPFAGGTYQEQGDNWKAGYITSGYRIDGSKNSPHKFALALDIAVGDIQQQIIWARAALPYFCRVGLYPQNGIIHIDLCDENWQKRFGAPASWVRIDGKYYHFETLEQSIAYASEA